MCVCGMCACVRVSVCVSVVCVCECVRARPLLLCTLFTLHVRKQVTEKESCGVLFSRYYVK